jgi:hypothetical protein
MGLIDTHYVENITKERYPIDEQMFINISMLKRGPTGGRKMIYHGHTIEVPLPSENIGCMC